MLVADFGVAEEADQPLVWGASRGRLEMRFAGRWRENDRLSRRRALERLCGSTLDLAWLKQIHSNRCLAARSGCTGEADALCTTQRNLVLCIQTADCVPIVVGNDGQVAAIHAGWRGIASGVVPAALERLSGPKTDLGAWIGPAIGPCCYEVGHEVARQVAAATTNSIVQPQGGGPPHLDLAGAVEFQLRQARIAEIHRSDTCTFCSGAPLWSYRRQGPGAGRNFTFAWLADDVVRTVRSG